MLSLWLSNTNVVFLWLFLIFHFSFSQKFFLSDTRSTKNKSELTFITLITAVHPLGVLCCYRCFSEGKEVGTEELEKKEEEQELPECLQLHQMVVRKIGEMCRVVNQVVTAAPEAASLSLFQKHKRWKQCCYFTDIMTQFVWQRFFISICSVHVQKLSIPANYLCSLKRVLCSDDCFDWLKYQTELNVLPHSWCAVGESGRCTLGPNVFSVSFLQSINSSKFIFTS